MQIFHGLLTICISIIRWIEQEDNFSTVLWIYIFPARTHGINIYRQTLPWSNSYNWFAANRFLNHKEESPSELSCSFDINALNSGRTTQPFHFSLVQWSVPIFKPRQQLVLAGEKESQQRKPCGIDLKASTYAKHRPVIGSSLVEYVKGVQIEAELPNPFMTAMAADRLGTWARK